MILPGIYEMCSSVTSPSALYTRAIVIVLDSVGVGELPDAASYGDRGSNTVGNIAKRIPLKLPTLRSLGFDRIASIGASVASQAAVPPTAIGRMAEASAGKDSVTGHWEMMGIVLDRPFPTFPDGFPADVITEFSRRTGYGGESPVLPRRLCRCSQRVTGR